MPCIIIVIVIFDEQYALIILKPCSKYVGILHNYIIFTLNILLSNLYINGNKIVRHSYNVNDF